MLSRLFIAVLWSLSGKGLTSWLSFVMFNCVFVTFPCGVLGQVWYLIILIPDLCHLLYFSFVEAHVGITQEKNVCSIVWKTKILAMVQTRK